MMLWMRRLLPIAVLVALLFAAPAAAFGPNGEAFWIADGYPDRKRLGPAQAKGVVLYLHGIAANQDSYHHALPSYVQLLRLEGWEILRHNRSNTQDRLYDSTQALLKAVRELKDSGYRKIVLAGQSRGAWFAASIAGKSPDVFAAISTAPGGYGDANIGTMSRSAEELGELLAEIRNTRVMLFLFNGDPRENVPGGRGGRSQRALTRAGVPFVVVDKPTDFWGHGASGMGRFTRRYGECIVRFVQAESLPSGGHECDQTTGAAAGGDVPRPRSFAATPPGPEIPRSLAGLVGQWYGDYEDGAARLLSIGAFNADSSARGYWAGAPRPGGDGKPFSNAATFQADGDALVLRESAGTRRFRLQADGTVTATWTPDSGKPLELLMRRQAGPKQ